MRTRAIQNHAQFSRRRQNDSLPRGSCKVAKGGAFGLTAKIPLEMVEVTKGSHKVFIQDNRVHREFCDNCGAFWCEYGEANVDKFRYDFAPGRVPTEWRPSNYTDTSAGI